MPRTSKQKLHCLADKKKKHGSAQQWYRSWGVREVAWPWPNYLNDAGRVQQQITAIVI